MSVRWKRPSTKCTEAEKMPRGGISEKEAGHGKKTCQSCGYKIRHSQETHEKGTHHQTGRKVTA